jgi:Tfp pilus assembly protein PilN
MRPRDFSTRPEPSRGGLALVLFGLLAFGLAAERAWTARSAREEALARVSEARRGLAELRERLQRRDAGPTDDVATTTRALAASAAPPSQVLGDVVALLPAGVRLDGLDLTYGRAVEVHLQVVARQAREYDDFIERLSRSARFDAVEPGPERREGEVRVSVRAAYRPEAVP